MDNVKLIDALETGTGLIPLEEIASNIEEFKRKYGMRRAFGTSSSTTKGDPLSV